MKTWYLKLDADNVILDAIEYPYEGYTEVQLEETHLPAGINGGWYTWNGTTYVLDQARKDAIDEANLTQRMNANPDIIQAAIDIYTLELINGGII